MLNIFHISISSLDFKISRNIKNCYSNAVLILVLYITD